jgi:Arc/MetJ-type ribon-helix-helix transcriptional regulator
MKTSDKKDNRKGRAKAVTVRVPVRLLRVLMRARKFATQSELIKALLTEEEERIRSLEVLQATAGTLTAANFDARLL